MNVTMRSMTVEVEILVRVILAAANLHRLKRKKGHAMLENVLLSVVTASLILMSQHIKHWEN